MRHLWRLFALGAAVPLGLAPIGGFTERDFSQIWSAGRAVLNGLSPYASAPFAYPPPALLVAAPLAMLPLPLAFILWDVIGAWLFYLAARPWLPKGFPAPLAVLTPSALFCLNFGQTGLLIGALWLTAFRGSGPAGGALILKPHLGFLILPRLLSNRPLFLGAVGVATALIITSILIGYWPDFFGRSVAQGGAILTHNYKSWTILAVTPLVGYGVAGWLLYAAGALYLLSRSYNVWTAASATFLISPYGLIYDLPVVCLGFALLLFEHWHAMPRWQRTLGCLGFLSPVIALGGTWWVPPILLAGLWLQVSWSAAEETGSFRRYLRQYAPRPL